MDVYMIWAKEPDGVLWLLEAWDEDSIAANGEGWDDMKSRAYSNHGAESVRIVKATVDFGKVQGSFGPSETTLNIKESK